MSSKTIAENRQARHEYFIIESYEAGIELSVYFMPGIGGRELSEENAAETAHVVSAINLLKESGLKYEIRRVFSETEEKDRVFGQSEAPNSQVEKNTIVILEVSDGPAPTEPTIKPTDPSVEPTEPSAEPTESTSQAES